MSTTPENLRIVVLGGGLAAAKATEELRERGHTGPITVVAGESHRPYERPPLSKEVLLGRKDAASAYVHDEGWYAEHDVELLTGTPATAIDREAREVEVGGRRLPYDRLLIATGSRPRRLPLADDSGAPVRYLRTIDDALALRADLHGSVLLVGAGWIGLEVAAAARAADARVTVVESAPLPLANVLGPELATVFADLHRAHGVDLRLATSVASIDHADGRTTVRLGDGTELHPDLVVVGIGAEPEDTLAAESGLATDHGVLVDAGLRTDDPHVLAAGDVANQDHPALGRIRVEHWDTAIHQGRHAARAMLGEEAPYDRQPYFFTDQYDLGMEYVGHVGRDGYDEVVIRGDREARVLTAFWVKDDRVLAGMHLNDWDAIDPIRAWVGRTATERFRDTSVPLGDLDPDA